MEDHAEGLGVSPEPIPVPQLPQVDLETILEDYRRRQMLEHLTGPIISMVIHIAIFALAFLLTGAPEAPKPQEFEVTIQELKVKPLEQKMIEKIVTERMDDPVPTVERPDIPAEVATETTGDGSVGMSSGASGAGGDFSDNAASTDGGMDDVAAVLDIKANRTPLKLAGLYSGRSMEGRAKMLKTGGGTVGTETAVGRALRWLKDHQNPDGSWAPSSPAAMTGLCLLAFLSHGETPQSKEFGMTVQKAMQYLSDRMVAANGGILEREYSHGIAAYALSEGYGMTKIPFLKPAMEAGLKTIVDGQQSRGGWDYGYKKDARWDLSVAGWQIQAMKAGFIAGAEVPGLLEGIEKSISFLKKVAYKDGRFGYSDPGAGSPGMTGVGALCLQLVGEGSCQEVKNSTKWISENVVVAWDKAGGGTTTYGWYYTTQAMFHAGQSYWKKWNDVFSDELIKNQKPDGHWDAPPPLKGQKVESGGYDPYMNTAFCCLMLQVYYRYLPTYKMPKTASTASSALDLDSSKDAGGLQIE